MSTPQLFTTGKRRVATEPNGRQYSVWPLVTISGRSTGYWLEEHHAGSNMRTYYVTGCGITRFDAEPYSSSNAAITAHERRA